MDKEKVVVTLLLITIILSLVSVIVTVSISGDEKVNSGNTLGKIDLDDTASVGLTVEPPNGTGGAG